MPNVIDRIRTFIRSEDGPTVTEYAVMLALIVLVCIAVISLVGNKVSNTYGTLEQSVPDGSGS